MWAPALSSLGANPLPVEVRRALRSPNEARHAVQDVVQRLSATPARWSLLLYGAGPPSEALDPALAPYPVLALRVDELLRRLETTPFGEVIRQLRNQRAHGTAAG